MKSRFLWLFSAIVVSGIGAYFLRDLVQYYIVVPLTISGRILRILFNAFPQDYLWFTFLIICCLALLISFSRRKKILSNYSPPLEEVDSRAMQYYQWIKTSQKSDYSKWMLARKISELALNVLTFQERLPVDEVLPEIKHGAIMMPQEVREYLLAAQDMPSFLHFSETTKFWKINYMASPLEINPEIVIEFLEARLNNRR